MSNYYNYNGNSNDGSIWKVVLLVIAVFIFMFALHSCNADPGYTYDYEDTESYTEDLSDEDYSTYYSEISQRGFSNIGTVGDNNKTQLIYDVDTKIVYMLSKGYYDYPSLCPYYAPNGLPYKYDSSTNSLVMITE